jgi:hypothetical protein
MSQHDSRLRRVEQAIAARDPSRQRARRRARRAREHAVGQYVYGERGNLLCPLDTGWTTVAKKYTAPHQPEGTSNEGTAVVHQVQVTPQGARRQPQRRRSTARRRSVATRPSGHQVCTTAQPQLR